MNVRAIYLARLCSASWRFSSWIKFVILSFLISGIGWLIEKFVNFFGIRFPQYSVYWAKLWQFSQKLNNFGEELVIVILIAYFIVWFISKIAGVKVIRSNRLSSNLRQMLLTTVDRIPLTDQNKRDKAKNISAEKANKAVKRSFVIARKESILAVVKIPKQIETRKLLIDYLDDVANDLSGQTGMTSSAWQTVSNGLTFSNYRVMEFRK